MSSAVVSTSAALGRPFVFDGEAVPDACSRVGVNRQDQADSKQSPIARILQSTIKNQQSKIPPARVTPASQLDIRPAPEMVSSGIPAIDSLAGGLPRGCLTEICGPASSGRTTLLLAALAAATQRGEFCAVVDASDALDPDSAVAAGVELDRLLWVRCGDNSPQRHRGTDGNNFKGSPKQRVRHREKIFERSNSIPQRKSVRKSTGAGSTRHRFAPRKRRLRLDRSRSRRSAATVRPPHPADHMVPLPPRGRKQIHHPAGNRAPPHRRKLLFPARTAGIVK